MSDYSALERLLGLPEGSTEGSDEKQVAPLLSKGVKNKTNELETRMKKVDALDDLAPSELVKSGLSMELLEQDKVTLRNEAFEVYRIAKSILERFKEDMDERVDIGDRLYTAGGKIIESVSGSLDKLSNMLIKFRQEEEMRSLSIVDENENGTKQMTPQDWMDFVNQVRSEDEDDDEPAGIVQDAEIIDEESSDKQ